MNVRAAAAAFLLASIAGPSIAVPADRQRHVDVPFVRIQAAPEKFEGVAVKVVGFIAVDRGRLKVYPSRDSYVFDDQSSAISVRGSFEDLTKIAKRFSRTYVMFVGKFHQISREGNTAALGEFTSFKVLGATDSEIRLKDTSSNEVFREVP